MRVRQENMEKKYVGLFEIVSPDYFLPLIPGELCMKATSDALKEDWQRSELQFDSELIDSRDLWQKLLKTAQLVPGFAADKIFRDLLTGEYEASLLPGYENYVAKMYEMAEEESQIREARNRAVMPIEEILKWEEEFAKEALQIKAPKGLGEIPTPTLQITFSNYALKRSLETVGTGMYIPSPYSTCDDGWVAPKKLEGLLQRQRTLSVAKNGIADIWREPFAPFNGVRPLVERKYSDEINRVFEKEIDDYFADQTSSAEQNDFHAFTLSFEPISLRTFVKKRSKGSPKKDTALKFIRGLTQSERRYPKKVLMNWFQEQTNMSISDKYLTDVIRQVEEEETQTER